MPLRNGVRPSDPWHSIRGVLLVCKVSTPYVLFFETHQHEKLSHCVVFKIFSKISETKPLRIAFRAKITFVKYNCVFDRNFRGQIPEDCLKIYVMARVKSDENLECSSVRTVIGARYFGTNLPREVTKRTRHWGCMWGSF